MYVKIGVSDDPYSRIGSIQTGCPIPLVKAGMVKCMSRAQARLIEKELHVELAPFGSNGEWFRFDWTDGAHKQALNVAIEAHMSRVKDWALEDVDLEKVFAMKRLIEAHRKNAYRERRRRATAVRAAVGI
ncbi:GIY-YIG nuclease family protein [Stenotrophomonas maltophilia]|nr:GIY-YIG nuclease family protein [Stenotrophomonas maltophilia]